MKSHKQFFLITNTAVFIVVALMHAWRVIANTPMTIGNFQVPVHLSALAVLFLGFLAWENWQMISNKSSKTVAKLLALIFVADGIGAIAFFALGLEILGISGSTFAAVAIFDFAVAIGLWRYHWHHK